MDNPLAPPPDMTPLEQEVLEEYERLAANMNKVSHPIPSHPAPVGEREREREFYSGDI